MSEELSIPHQGPHPDEAPINDSGSAPLKNSMVSISNLPGEDGLTLLHHAVKNGDVEKVRSLLAAGAAVDPRDKNGSTPLLLAVFYGEDEIVNQLLKHRADVNALDDTDTPIRYAAAAGHDLIAKYLLDAKADKTLQDSKGRDALHIAASCGHINVVTTLLRRDAAINTRDQNQGTPLMAAAMCGKSAVVELLLQQELAQTLRLEMINAVDIYGRTALHYAARAGGVDKDPCDNQREYVQIVEKLIQTKAQVNVLDNYGRTPLLLAAYYANAAVVSPLLKGGARVNANDGDPTSALIVAARAGKLEVVELLLKEKAAVNQQSSTKESALFAAVENQSAGVVMALLAARADAHESSRDGVTAYQLAESRKLSAFFKLLLSKPEAKGQQSLRTAVAASATSSRARKKNKSKAQKSGSAVEFSSFSVEPSVSMGIDIRDENFLKKVKAGDKAEVDTLLTAKANLEAQDLSGNTPLMVAILNGHEALASSLLDHKALPNVVNKRKQSPLHLAALKASSLLDTLLSTNDVNAQDDDGQTPLMLAAKSKKSSLGAIEKIIQAKAHPQLRNQEKQTAADLATAADISQYLQKLIPAAVVDKKREAKKPVVVPRQMAASFAAPVAHNPIEAKASSRVQTVRPVTSQESSIASRERTHQKSAVREKYAGQALTARKTLPQTMAEQVRSKPVASGVSSHSRPAAISAEELGNHVSFPPLPARVKVTAAAAKPVENNGVKPIVITAGAANSPAAQASNSKVNSSEQKTNTASNKPVVSALAPKLIVSPAQDPAGVSAASKPVCTDSVAQSVTEPLKPAESGLVITTAEPAVTVSLGLSSSSASAISAKYSKTKEVKRVPRPVLVIPRVASNILADCIIAGTRLAANLEGHLKKADDDLSYTARKEITSPASDTRAGDIYKLILAVEKNDIDTLSDLVKRGRKDSSILSLFKTVSENGETFLHHSIRYKSRKVTAYLLENLQQLGLESSLGHCDIGGDSPLFVALEEEDITSVRLILKAAAKLGILPSVINKPHEEDGVTPLMTAIQWANSDPRQDIIQLIQEFLDHGADIDAVDKENDPVDDYVENPAVMQLLQAHRKRISERSAGSIGESAAQSSQESLARLWKERSSAIAGADSRASRGLAQDANTSDSSLSLTGSSGSK